jgi:hypothetical protein
MSDKKENIKVDSLYETTIENVICDKDYIEKNLKYCTRIRDKLDNHIKEIENKNKQTKLEEELNHYKDENIEECKKRAFDRNEWILEMEVNENSSKLCYMFYDNNDHSYDINCKHYWLEKSVKSLRLKGTEMIWCDFCLEKALNKEGLFDIILTRSIQEMYPSEDIEENIENIEEDEDDNIDNKEENKNYYQFYEHEQGFFIEGGTDFVTDKKGLEENIFFAKYDGGEFKLISITEESDKKKIKEMGFVIGSKEDCDKFIVKYNK